MATYLEGINDRNLSKKYSELNDKQREKLTAKYGDEAQSKFKEARQRMAGDAASGGGNTSGEGNQAPAMDPEKDSIYSYDTGAYGAGSKKGTERLSAKDIKHLDSQGYSREEIIDYATNIKQTGVKSGAKAQALLDKYKAGIINSGDTGGENTGDGDTGGGDTGGGDTGGGEQQPPATGDIDQGGGDNSQVIEAPDNNDGGGGSGGGNQNVNQNNDQNVTVIGDGNTTESTQDNSVRNGGGGTVTGTNMGTGNRNEERPAASNQDLTVNQNQNVNQNNDQNVSVTGDNNTTISEQDNSVRYYGGSNRVFNYSGGRGNSSYEDTPASSATLAGFYAPDDSPAAIAAQNDLFTTMNRDNQKKYANAGKKTASKYSNFDARSFTDNSIQDAINRSTMYSTKKGDSEMAYAIGDIWNANYAPGSYKFGKAPKPIESDVKEIAEDATDKIENT